MSQAVVDGLRAFGARRIVVATAYADEVNGAQTANQRRTAYSGGVRFDHTWVPDSRHLVKGGFQIDYSRANNTSQIFAFDTSGGAPVGPYPRTS